MSYFDDNEGSLTGLKRRKPAKAKLSHILKEIEETENKRNGANFLGDRKAFKKHTEKLIRLWKSIQ